MRLIIPGLMIAALSAAVGGTTHEQSIEQRQAAYKEMKAAVAEVKDAMKAKDFRMAGNSAAALLSKAKRVTELFPPGSYEGKTRAKKKIWENQDDFQERQQHLISSAQLLVEASQSNDITRLKDTFKNLSKDCKGCHRKYRQIF